MSHSEYLAAIKTATAAAREYYNGTAATLTDSDYDNLLEAILAYGVQHPEHAHLADALTNTVAAGTAETGTVELGTPMLSLEKLKTLDDVAQFEKKVSALGGTVALEPKMDGLAVQVEYRDGQLTMVATRGDGHTGENLTKRVLNLDRTGLPEHIDEGGNHTLRGELVMTRSDFATANRNRVAAGHQPFANPRNATAGTVRKDNPDYASGVTLVVYEAFGLTSQAQQELGFIPVGTTWDGDNPSADVTARVELFGADRTDETFAYPTDGIVIKAVEPDVRAELGETSRAPRWAVAFKFDAERSQTTIRDIEVGVGRTGNISFTAVVDHVKVDGSTVSRATLHNPDFIAENNIRVGSVVEIYKANDIIPRIVKVVEQPAGTIPYEPPTVSPSGAPLDTSGAIWRSTDPSESIGALIAYAASRDALDIDGLSTAIADSLVSGDHPLVADLADLFELTAEQLAGVSLPQNNKKPRLLGQKTANKVHANIQAAKNQPLNRVITALGIRKSGRTFGRRLAAHFGTMTAILAATHDDFSQVEGVGTERAGLFHTGFQQLTPVIHRLAEAGVNMGSQEQTGGDATSLPLAGQKIVVTGAMTGPLTGLSRNEMNELIARHGGTTSGSVSKNTTLLVCAEEGSSKWAKANALGVTIVTPDEFAAMIGA